nr:MAG TPA: LAMBDA REPRESSOR (TRIPLE MUTANT)/DNA COMPLEX-DNA COMPLEX, DOUBLE HELIX, TRANSCRIPTION-DNA.1A [Caudoviricetes sp.]
MEDTVKQRLIRFLKYKHLSQAKFESKIGLSNGYVNNIRKSLQPDKLQRIAQSFPELNITWLLTGEEQMLNTIHQQVGNIENSTAIGVNVNGSNNSFEVAESDIIKVMNGYLEIIRKQQEQIDELISIIKNHKQ